MYWHFFETVNRETRTRPSELVKLPPITRILWRPGTEVNGWVITGTILGTAYFNNGGMEDIIAPSNCAGIIAAVRPKIPYAQLATGPSIWLIRLH